MRLVLCILLAFAALFFTSVCTNTSLASELEMGVAVTDITPPLSYRMSGYFHERLNEGTHDPLQAKAIVLRQGTEQTALVFCDIIGLSLDVSRRAREQAQAKTGIPKANICIAATHSHTGPLYCGAIRKKFHDRAIIKHGTDPYEKIDYSTQLVEKIVRVIEQAKAAAKPVTLQEGVAQQLGLSFNRRFHMKNGPVRFNPPTLSPELIRPAGPIDPEVGILLFRDAANDRPLASLTVFALHLDTVGGTKYSADFPYYLAQSLKKELGNNFVSTFGIGTCGDINHIDRLHRGPRLKTPYIGQTLANTVKAELPKLKTVKCPLLAARSETVHVPLQQYTPEEVARAEETMKQADFRKVPFLERVRACKIVALQLRGGGTAPTEMPIEVQVVRLSNNVAIISLPGEVFVDLGLAIKKASPFATTIIFELANDAPGYIPTRKAFAEGSYETVNSRVQTGGGEKMVDTAIRLLKQLK